MYYSLKKHFKNNGVIYNETQNKFTMKFLNPNLKELIVVLTKNNRKMRMKSTENTIVLKMFNEETANEFAEILRTLEIL